MKLVPLLLLTLCLLQLTVCFQACIVDFVRKFLNPKKSSEDLPVEHRLNIVNRIQNASKAAKLTSFNEKGLINDVPIIRKGVDVIMEGSSTPKPVEKTSIPTNDDNRIRNNITIITRSEVDVITDAEADTEVRLNEDLLDSFGGMEGEGSYEGGEAQKTNGMYFLLDWNTFLEVDDQNGKRVNLRVQPKVGDPKQFIDVTVP